MALVEKNDIKQIFADQAPSIDKPATFANYPRGWDTARPNNGKPTIKQFNYLQQRTDQNILWIHQNGAALPYDATMEYAEGAVVVKDGELQQKQSGSWVVISGTGDIVTVETIADLIAIKNPKEGDSVCVKGRSRAENFAQAMPYRGGGLFLAVTTSESEDEGNIFTSTKSGVKWVRLLQDRYTLSNFGGKPYDSTFDNRPILDRILNSIYKYRVVANNMHNRTPNCGGAVIDLEGAEWFLTTPFKYKPYGGNYKFQNGVISAAFSFPVDEFLFSKDTVNTTSFNGTNDYITFDNVMFDGKERASGLQMEAAIRMLISKCFFKDTRTHSLYCGEWTIELFCSSTYFKNEKNNGAVTYPRYGIYIENKATDNHFTDCLLQNHLVSVVSYAQANTYKSVHSYGTDYRLYGNDCWAFAIKGNTSNNRLNDCQIDSGGRILLENPSRTQIRGASFASLDGAPVNAIVLKAVTNGHYCRGLVIEGNEFDLPSGSDAIVVSPDSLGFSVAEFKNNFVGNNVGGAGVNIRSTQFTIQSTVVKQKLVNIDYSSKFLIGSRQVIEVATDQSVKMLSIATVTPTVTGSVIADGTYPLTFPDNGHTRATGSLIATNGTYRVVLDNKGYYYDNSATASLANPIAGSTVTFNLTFADSDNEYEPVVGGFRSHNNSVLLNKRLTGYVRCSFETSN